MKNILYDPNFNKNLEAVAHLNDLNTFLDLTQNKVTLQELESHLEIINRTVASRKPPSSTKPALYQKILNDTYLKSLLHDNIKTLHEFKSVHWDDVCILQQKWNSVLSLLNTKNLSENKKNEAARLFQEHCQSNPNFLKFSLLIEHDFDSIERNFSEFGQSLLSIGYEPMKSSVIETCTMIKKIQMRNHQVLSFENAKILDSQGFKFDWLIPFNHNYSSSVSHDYNILLLDVCYQSIIKNMADHDCTQYIDLLKNNSSIMNNLLSLQEVFTEFDIDQTAPGCVKLSNIFVELERNSLNKNLATPSASVAPINRKI